jgi:fatty acid desaturase
VELKLRSHTCIYKLLLNRSRTLLWLQAFVENNFVHLYTLYIIYTTVTRKVNPSPMENLPLVRILYISYMYINEYACICFWTCTCTLEFIEITLLPFFIEMLQYDWLWSGHMIIKEIFYIPIKLKPELARASMTTSDVNNQWRSNFQQQII